MPLHISVFSDDPQCAGHAWTVTDEDKLARLVARLLVGHYRHVQSILEQLPQFIELQTEVSLFLSLT